jgi:asparagine synthase (glutamine-hydrolysing)
VIFYTERYFTDSYHGLFRWRDFFPQVDLTGLTTFLKIGYIPAPVTSLSGVQKVPAGEAMTFQNGRITREELFPYEEILNAKRIDRTAVEAIGEYHDLLKNSIRRRIAGMSQVAALLSGGFDSGGNIAVLREVFSGAIKTYSIGFKDNPASELPYAKMMADQYGAEHHEYIMDGREIEFLPEIIDIMGDPFSESGFMLNHSAMKLVSSERLPVVLGGDGNDQYFGAGIRETAIHYKMRKSGLAHLAMIFNLISDNSFFDHDNLAFRIHFQNQKILMVMEPETFGFHDYQLKRMFDMKRVSAHPWQEIIPHKFSTYEELFLQRNFYLHLRHTVNEVILNKASRMSAHFGVNLTFPYTDLDIYHFLQELPLQLRAKGSVEESMRGQGISKYIHKELVKPMLPKAVTSRPKQGGFSPLEIFFNEKSRREKIYRYIRASEFARTLKDQKFTGDFCTAYESLASGKGYWFWYRQVKSNQMLNLLIATIWYDRVIKGIKKDQLSDYIG